MQIAKVGDRAEVAVLEGEGDVSVSLFMVMEKSRGLALRSRISLFLASSSFLAGSSASCFESGGSDGEESVRGGVFSSAVEE